MATSVCAAFVYDRELGRRARAVALKSTPTSFPTKVCFCSTPADGLQGILQLELTPSEKSALTKAENVQSLMETWQANGSDSPWREEAAEIKARERLIAKGWKVSSAGWDRLLSGEKSLLLRPNYQEGHRFWVLLLHNQKNIRTQKVILLANIWSEKLATAVRVLSTWEDAFAYA